MIRLVETGVSKIIRRYRVAIAKDNRKITCMQSCVTPFIVEGFVFPINIYVNYFWHVHHDFCFSALILKVKSDS